MARGADDHVVVADEAVGEEVDEAHAIVAGCRLERLRDRGPHLGAAAGREPGDELLGSGLARAARRDGLGRERARFPQNAITSTVSAGCSESIRTSAIACACWSGWPFIEPEVLITISITSRGVMSPVL